MAHPNADVVRTYINALAAGDLDGVGGHLAEDVEFHIPGRNPLSGDKRGRDEVLGMFRTMMDLAGGPLAADLHDLLANDEHVTRTIAGVQARAVIVYHVEGGKISEVWVHEADQYALDEATS